MFTGSDRPVARAGPDVVVPSRRARAAWAGKEHGAGTGSPVAGTTGPSIRELGVVAVALTALAILFFLTPIVRHELLSPADALLAHSPWSHHAPPGYVPANGLMADYVIQFKPWRDFAVAALRDGRLPLWNPANYAGAPFLGNGISAVLFPLNLPFLLLPEAPAVLVWAIARLVLAGLSAYAFARLIGLGSLGAATTALAFAFSGFMVVWTFWPQVNVAMWLPALFAGGELLVRRPGPAAVVGLAAIVCIQFLGGHPETSLHVLAAATLYVGWRAVARSWPEGDWRGPARCLAAFAGAVTLGTGGAAIQLLPLGEYVLNSIAWLDRAAQAPPLWPLASQRLLAMLALVCPYCLGSYLRGDIPIGVRLHVGNFNELSGAYVGLLALLLAPLAVALGARRWLTGVFGLIAGLAFLVAYRIYPIYDLVHALPLWRLVRNERLLLLLGFALAVLAGRGADLLAAGAPDRLSPRARRQLLVALAASILVLAAAFGLIAVVAARMPDTGSLARVVRRAGHEAPGRVGLLAASAAAIALALAPVAARARLAWALPLVLVVDLFMFGKDYNPSIPPRLAYPAVGALDFVRAQPGLFRVLALDGVLPPNTNLVYGLSDIRGYDALEPARYHRFLAAAGDYSQPMPHFRTLLFPHFQSRLVDFLNVRYVLSDRELDHPKLVLAWEGGTRVYENRGALERATLVYRTRVLDEAGVEAALRDPLFDPATTVFLEGTGRSWSGPVDPDARAAIERYDAERVVVRIGSRHDAVLVLADMWFPGWEATIDGVTTKVLRANLAFRAVATPAGQHEVVFRYRPLAVRLGVAVSLVSLLAALTLLLLSLRSSWARGRRGASAWPSR